MSVLTSAIEDIEKYASIVYQFVHLSERTGLPGADKLKAVQAGLSGYAKQAGTAAGDVEKLASDAKPLIEGVVSLFNSARKSKDAQSTPAPTGK